MKINFKDKEISLSKNEYISIHIIYLSILWIFYEILCYYKFFYDKLIEISSINGRVLYINKQYINLPPNISGYHYYFLGIILFVIIFMELKFKYNIDEMYNKLCNNLINSLKNNGIIKLIIKLSD